MADKLSESTWTSFSKGLTKKYPKLDPKKLKLEDAALVKALAAYDKTDESKPEPRLKALEELIKQIPEQVKALVKRKKELGDEPFDEAKDKLYALLREAEGLHKSALAKAAEAKGKGKDDDEEEEESPALLTSKMIPLLRELKKGEVAMPFLVALAGKETVVLVSRRPISPARGKLLKEQMAQPTGLKFIRGECRYENNALTFVVQSPGAALAKRLRQALLDQTAMRWKVRVRGEDGVEEEDGDEEEQARKPATPEQLAYTQRLLKVRERYQQALREQHPKAVQFKELMDLASAKANEQQDYAGAIQVLQALEKALDEPERTQGGGVDSGAAFKARLTALLPRIKEAIAAARPAAKDIKLKASEAGVFAGKRDFERANALLHEVEDLLAIPFDDAADAVNQAQDTDDAAKLAQDHDGRPERPTFDEAEFRATWQKARDGWTDAVETVDAQIAKLQAVLREQADEDLVEIAELGLPALTGDFKAPMMAAVMDVDRAGGDGLPRAARRARSLAASFAEYLDEAETIAVTDDNDFGVTVTIRKTIGGALRVLEDTLAAAG